MQFYCLNMFRAPICPSSGVQLINNVRFYVAIPGKPPGLWSAGLLGVSTVRRMWPGHMLGYQLPFYTAWNFRRKQISINGRRKLKITQLFSLIWWLCISVRPVTVSNFSYLWISFLHNIFRNAACGERRAHLIQPNNYFSSNLRQPRCAHRQYVSMCAVLFDVFSALYVYSAVYVCSAMCLVLFDVCSAVLHALVAGLLTRSQYHEGPATGHLGTGFPVFPVPESECWDGFQDPKLLLHAFM
jgi:hypothetical protein